jgi:predicted nuclease of predicted toxin-antitoxin system
MHFLLDANMPRSALTVIVEAGHDVTHVRDLPIRHAPDETIVEHARANGMALITRDLDLCDIRQYPPERFAGLVVLRVPDTARAELIAALVRDVVQRPELIARIPGSLLIAEFGRVRFRPK